jgi:hypothetical protein
MKTNIKSYCKRCDICSARKPNRKSNKAPLGQQLIGGPMEKVSMDILGPFIMSLKGNKYVLTICDKFTKWTKAIALPDQEASTIADAFVNNFICRFGTPLQIHTDQGKNFKS